ncbi:MAG TPA: carbohydrate binding domain-containing protein, partial [Pedobacter sp.]|nr:carbohydrate binding domain-containing protein [Pedobacter sp.]
MKIRTNLVKKKLKLLYGLCAMALSASGQTAVSFPSPNAAELGKYGQIPVELFNGLPAIGIPIHVIQNKNIQVPINLSYHASGIRTEQHPTWVGLGWSLSSGGSITRIVNGRKDETLAEDIQKETGWGYNYSGFGNFYAYSLLNNSDWAESAGFHRFRSEHLYSSYIDSAPDEFMISAPGLSASFYFYRDAQDVVKIKVKSKDGRHIRVEPELVSYPSFNFYSNNPYNATEPYRINSYTQSFVKPFYKFVVTTEDGTKYVFGGSQTSIEFYTTEATGYRNTIPSSWYLTEISSSPTVKVNFIYKRSGNPIVENNVITKTFSYVPGATDGACLGGCSEEFPGSSLTIQHPIYLSTISASDGTFIELFNSKSTELPYEINVNNFLGTRGANFNLALDIRQIAIDQNYWVKLDSIKINKQKKIVFNYSSDITKRLKLNSVAFKNLSNNTLNSYTLTYNSTMLPVYNAKRSDNWGYFNNKFYQGVDPTTFYDFRSPDTALMKAEVLTKIAFPTGGYSIFEYEAHTYSKVATQFPLFTVTNQNGVAGGLRIKKITSSDGLSINPSIIKEYSYVNEDNTSSGILSGLPIYIATGHAHAQYSVASWSGLAVFRARADYHQAYAIISENYLNMLGNTNGSHVAYSRVIESTPGAGKIVNKYTNHDSHPDESPVNLFTNIDDRTRTDDFTSKQLERGLLLSTSTFNQNNTLLHDVTFEYNSDPTRYEDYIKTISKWGLPGPGEVPFVRLIANKIYTFYPYLKKKTIRELDINGAAVTTTESFLYAPEDKTVKESSKINSNNDLIKVSYFYPKDMPGSVYLDMANKHFISPVMLKTTTVNNVSTDYQLTQYINPFTDIFVPSKVYRGKSSSVIEPLFSYDLYDNQGNILTVSKEKGPKTSYQWGYNKTYPVAAVKNASTSEFYNQNFEDKIIDFDQNLTLDSSRAHTGRYSAKISNTGSAEKISHSTTWIPVNLNSAKRYTFSGWVYSDNPSVQLFLFMLKSGETGYNSYNDHMQTTVKNKWVYMQKEFLVPGDVVSLYLRLDNNTVGNVWFDDLRIQPSESDMTTYTYRPQVGMTSSIDNSGRIT